ncbi:hypothetical protein A5844_000121 [Enterococcus sp. 10A9_DIV0425]|uniref:Isochorismatase-like domain-containing protein n=1 Tax=Candidatus Enterococcus wittei TaxID=1987383 RepID=A0A2C9XQB4_9ENTE|nr:isochorismatase family cysteine hydrolase [Enterococcus sp. 10A9_DIV0425]OTP11907.1 hypothetical protein A5844_000121 [Enterococcus sp. 10A9_DIV0425]
MLVVVDMQNHILDQESEYYIEGADQLVTRIRHRLQQAREADEYVLFTMDIPIERKGQEEEHQDLQLIPELSPLPNERVVKKNYFTIPPKTLLDIQETFFESKDQQKTIEVVGIETNLCVLSNTVALQSAFPEGDFLIDSSLVASRNHETAALALLKDFNMEVK